MNPPRILVLGDAMLDRYWDGVVDRISPEAPVPVLRVTRRFERPGGAANVAANLAALGAAVSLVALVGDDADGACLGALMDDAGVGFDRIVDADYATTAKIRCVARHHQMLRADFEMAPPPAMRTRLAERFARALPVRDLVVLSDYAKGALDACAPLIEAARAAGKPVLVDPKGRDWTRYAGATLLKPKLAALDAVLGDVADEAERERRIGVLRERFGWRHVLVTRGEGGMTLFDDAGATHERAQVHEVHDVTGAGDTVLATLAWRLAEGDDARQAMRWASVAAGLAVQVFGTAVLTRDELLDAWDARR
ncbi:MAG: PfkB family carbohydrate kinase [Burkholderiaceae bacterium]